jgi:hypothetical protein
MLTNDEKKRNPNYINRGMLEGQYALRMGTFVATPLNHVVG